MSILKQLIRLFPGGEELAARHSYRRRARKLEAIGDTQARFEHIFHNNKWKSAESVSGAGSTLEATRNLREALPDVVQRYGISRLLDVPCGDYNWIRRIDWVSPVDYTGGDIVSDLVESNNQQYADARTRFVHLNLITDGLPAADALLCRDCFIHLSFADIRAALKNIVTSDIDYLFFSTYTDIENLTDIPTGHCRFVNMEKPPFSLPPPLVRIPDSSPERPDKYLAAWQREQLTALFGAA